MTAKDLQIRELKDIIIDQKQLIGALNIALTQSNAQSEQLTEQIKLLNEQLAYLKQKLFGTSSERRINDNQLSLFNEVEVEATQSDEITPLEVTVQSHNRKPKKLLSEKLSGIPVEQVICDIEGDKTCDQCGTELVKIGQEVVRRELEYIPAKVKVLEYVSLHYGCPECKETEEPYFEKAVVPKALMKHSIASPSSVAWVMYQKYANGLPLYRQEKDWKMYGIELSRATMANWVIYSATNYLKPLYDYCHRLLLKRDVLMADETRVQVLKEDGRNAETDSYMWLYRSGEDGLNPIILYKYCQTRAGYNALEFLKGFGGYLMTDGYSGYNKLTGIKRCCCWAHVRRYFIEAVPKGHEFNLSKPAVQGVEFCTKLFKIEEELRKKEHTPEQRRAIRLQKEKPILEAFWSWIEEQRPVRNSKFHKAIVYTVNRKPYLETYLEDGRCSLSNNLSENAIRPFTIGRKGWLFCDTPAGAESSAIVYSIVEMAKAHGLNIYKYLNFLLTQRPSISMNDSELELLSPWSEAVKASCSIEVK